MRTEQARSGLFDQEREVIAHSRGYLQRLQSGEGDLRLAVEGLSELIEEYEKLYKVVKKISVISDAQSAMLTQQEADLQMLLDHAGQGFLTIGSDLLVNEPYSRECERIFDGVIKGRSICDLLAGGSAEKRMLLEEQLLRVMDAKQADLSQAISELPDKLIVNNLRLELDYKRISDPRRLSNPDDLVIMLMLTDVTERYKSQEQVRYLSTHDMLTGLFNRPYLERYMQTKLVAADYPLSLLVIDLNGLKLANDVFGHRTGDRLLKLASSLLQEVFEEQALISRWGGDEFVVVLKNTTAAQLRDWQERLRIACQHAPKANAVRLSMAIGGATTDSPHSDPILDVFVAAEKMMYKHKLLENRQFRLELIEGLTEVLMEQGGKEEAHIRRLLAEAEAFAGHLGIVEGSKEMKLVRNLAKLHDAGNLMMPTYILQGNGPLDEEDWEIVKGHSEIGYRMAQSIGEWELAEAILGMHERWDGTGYPYGLSGEQIPYFSRFLSVLDAFDIMTHDQSYKSALSSSDAMDQLRSGAGSQFDAKLVNAYLAWKHGQSDAS